MSNPYLNKLRRTLDSITMYRVLLYALGGLAGVTLLLSVLDVLKYSSFGVLSATLGLLLVTCFSSNLVLSKLYKVAANYESALITALILFFVLASPSQTYEWIGVVVAGLIAMASKYIVTWRGAHIFNPAAFGVLLVSIVSIGSGAWWVANETLYFPMLIMAAIVLVKIRRFQVFLAFLLPAVALIVMRDMSGDPLTNMIYTALTLFPVLFLGSIMLTEPSTMPNTRYMSILFAIIVGVIFASNIEVGSVAASPHLALLIGNVLAFVVSARAAAQLVLVDKQALTPTTFSYAFQPSRPIKRIAGQYMEFTMAGVKLDSRSNRRTFTIASEPSDDLVKIGIKFYQPGSQFKNSLQSLKVGGTISGSHVAGDFIMPNDASVPLVFVAGGIGITPFIAMIQEIIATKSSRTIDLYYFVSDTSEIAYKDILTAAKAYGVTTHPKIGRESRLTDDDIKAHPGAHYYLSGPPGMVAAYKSQLKRAKVQTIHTDLFTGY